MMVEICHAEFRIKKPSMPARKEESAQRFTTVD
jgi:hypothetical protein